MDKNPKNNAPPAPRPPSAAAASRRITQTVPVYDPAGARPQPASGNRVTQTMPALRPATGERSSYGAATPGSVEADPHPDQLAQRRQARIQRMARRAVTTDPQRTEHATKALRGMLELRLRSKELILPVMPTMAMKLNEALNSSSTDVHQASDIISSDAAVAARVIQVANSVVFRGISPINTVSSAIVRLGLRTTSSIVMALCQKGLYRASTPQVGQLMEDMFMHGFASGTFARFIASAVRYRQPEEAFVAALLHDVASPFILRLLADIMQANPGLGYSESELLAVVTEVHSGLGVTMLERWEMSSELIYAVGHHVDVAEGHPHARLNNIGFLANVLAKRCGFGLIDEPDLATLEANGAQALGLEPAVLEAIKAQAIDRAEREGAIITSVIGPT